MSTLLNGNKELRTIMIGYAIAPQPQPTSSFIVGQNITTTPARTTDAWQTPNSIRVTGINPLQVCPFCPSLMPQRQMRFQPSLILPLKACLRAATTHS